MRKTYARSTISSAVLAALAGMAVMQGAQAGSGFVDALRPDGVTTFRLPTYFAYSPSGARATPVPEDTDIAAAEGRAANFTGTALRKFVDPLALPMTSTQVQAAIGAGTLPAKYIPIAQATKWVNPQGVVTGDDYYELAVVEYKERFHSDLAGPTTLRGYVQIDHEASNGRTPLTGSLSFPLTYPSGAPIMIAGTDANGKLNGTMVQALSVDKPRFLGPIISATKDVPTRVKFINLLPVGRIEYNGDGSVKARNGDLFLPLDPVIAGAGFGPDGLTEYTQNRANIHLHGGDTPWISDGTPHQWLTPAGEGDVANPNSLAGEFTDPFHDPALLPEFLRGASTQNVPDMNDPGAGAWTLYFANGQTARMLWYHDHSVGITRLNVYAGMASAYLLSDSAEQAMITSGALPPAERTLPLVLQDRTFVPADISLQDANWSTQHWGGVSDSWFPHVYETVQDPAQAENTNAVGRWHYGPYFWPVFPALYPLPSGNYGDVTTTPEAWMDTPIVNGVAYPTVEVDPTTYRFRVLNASNDRVMTFNILKAVDNPTLADGTVLTGNTGNFTEVDMVPAGPATPENACAPLQLRPSPIFNGDGSPKLNAQGKQMFCQPELWPMDGRLGGMPDPNSVGPAIHQIASEGGLLPAVHSIEPNPVTYIVDKGRINVFNVNTPSLQLAPAERADLVIDFSAYAGQTLLVYNDSGAPVPAGDPRNDTFTGVGDQSDAGGAEDTKPGFGPNIRTMMQIKVKALTPAAPLDVAALNTAVTSAYLATQEKPVVAQPAYAGFDASWGNLTDQQSFARIQTGSLKEPVFKYTPGTPNTSINSVTLLTQGSGYVTAPVVTISPPAAAGGRAASAKATLQLENINVLNGGSGYALAPTVSIVGGGGNGATAVAVLGVQTVTMAAGGAGYSSVTPPTVTFQTPPVGGRRATGTATVNAAGQVTGVIITDAGTGYTATPMVSFGGGGGTGARATTKGLVTEVRLQAADPQNPASAGGGGFVNLDVNAGGNNPFEIVLLGGGGTGATADATGRVFDITLDFEGRGYAPGEVPTVSVAAPAAGVGATAQSDLAGGGTATGSILVKPKAIQELFDATYGRLNATLGVELPFTSAMTQTTIPLGYLDEPTEVFSDGETQLWKITHNGVDSHPVHFHLLNVQLVNRVDWAGIIMPPNKNELGWKETVVMNPLEDVIVAVRAKTPSLPGFSVPLSIRAMDPAQPLGSPFGFTQIDPITGTPKTVVNDIINFGWEYVWHCHILGHEENDFMRPVVFDARETPPLAPFAVTAAYAPGAVTVNWTDPTPATMVSSSSEVGFRVQRAPTGSTTFQDVPTDLHTIVGLTGKVNALANATTFTDTSLSAGLPGGTPPVTPNTPVPGAVSFTSVGLSWTLPATTPANAEVTGIKVLRADVDAAGVVGAFASITPVALPATAVSYTDGSALPGSKYQYQVLAQGVAGDVSLDYRVASVNVTGEVFSAPATVLVSTGSAVSEAASAASATAITPMIVPTAVGLSVAPGAAANQRNVTFAWNAVPSAAGYLVRTRLGTTANNGAWTGWTPVAGTDFTQANVVVANNSFITFEVQAVSVANVNSASLSSGAVQMAIPAAPVGRTLVANTPTDMTMGWTARANASSYTVQYATDALFAVPTTVPGITTTSFAAAGLSPNVRYWFRVASASALGAGAFSASSNLYTLANPVAAAPSQTLLTGTSVTLNWLAPVGGATTYLVQRSANGGATWTTAGTTAATTLAVTGLLGNTSYQFRVVARNGNTVAAAPSPVANVTTLQAAPTGVSAANGITGGVITAGLNFTANGGAGVTYQVQYRNTALGSPFIGPIASLPAQQHNVGGTARSVIMQVRSVNAGVPSAWSGNVTVLAR